MSGGAFDSLNEDVGVVSYHETRKSKLISLFDIFHSGSSSWLSQCQKSGALTLGLPLKLQSHLYARWKFLAHDQKGAKLVLQP